MEGEGKNTLGLEGEGGLLCVRTKKICRTDFSCLAQASTIQDGGSVTSVQLLSQVSKKFWTSSSVGQWRVRSSVTSHHASVTRMISSANQNRSGERHLHNALAARTSSLKKNNNCCYCCCSFFIARKKIAITSEIIQVFPQSTTKLRLLAGREHLERQASNRGLIKVYKGSGGSWNN